MYGLILLSNSIHILSIQINIKSLELVIYHQFNNIKLSFFASHMKSTTLVADPLATLETSIAYCPKRMRTLLNLEYYLKMQILADLSPPVHLQ